MNPIPIFFILINSKPNLDKQSEENIIFQTAVKNNWYQHPSCTNEFVVKS